MNSEVINITKKKISNRKLFSEACSVCFIVRGCYILWIIFLIIIEYLSLLTPLSSYF